ncbi:hypothetical protein GS399_10030 [Pedobacter sp. HMF7647]|uniref:Uncharacterized protein n=1 Tax=Hufsiella arboris TaxID=2695275 RepID=A0A7K1Y9N7_9SPHI|nr:hypothetical protein [Hufsiella arboris]MXV51306.1 hypothetical protein [Hufsiella arboris]
MKKAILLLFNGDTVIMINIGTTKTVITVVPGIAGINKKLVSGKNKIEKLINLDR